jgi:LuxR family transcriptional regulator, maltose regulon positive regulatory protein
MTFVCHGAPMESLLREAERRVISPAYVCRLLEAFTKGMPGRVTAETYSSKIILPEPISKRELEVLRLLASSLSGPQIADELFISLGTFQTHTKSIYGKLGVHNRLEAIERAKVLKLL